MGLSARMKPFKIGFRPFPTEIYRIPFPDKYHKITLDDTKRAFGTLFGSEIEPTQIAAAFFEPVQGEGGYNIAEPLFLEYLRELCDEHVRHKVHVNIPRTMVLLCCIPLPPELVQRMRLQSG